MNIQTQTGAAMQSEVPPQAQLMNLVGGSFVSQAIYVAAKLGIADLLANEARSAADLARETEMHERSLYRLLRTLASVGVFRETEPKIFENTPVSESLKSNAEASLRDAAIWMGEEPHWRVYGNLMHSVKTGKPAWSEVHGEDVFPYLFGTNRELGDIFNRAMTSISAHMIQAMLAAYDFSQVKVLADIAGGYGHLLAGIMHDQPEIKGVLFDLVPVCEDAAKFLEKENVADRVEIICGNFFQSVPVSADVYMLKYIIHDWNDDECVTILKNIKAEMSDDAKIIIIETVIPEDNEPHFGKILDMEMLLSPGGIERTAGEFEQLLDDSGLKLNRIIPTQSMFSIVEAIKA
jgi:hypothetical protein